MVVTSPGPTHSSPSHDSSNSHPTPIIINQPLNFHYILTLHNKFKFSNATISVYSFPTPVNKLILMKKQTLFFRRKQTLVSATVKGKIFRQFCPACSSRIVYYILEISIHSDVYESKDSYLKDVSYFIDEFDLVFILGFSKYKELIRTELTTLYNYIINTLIRRKLYPNPYLGNFLKHNIRSSTNFKCFIICVNLLLFDVNEI